MSGEFVDLSERGIVQVDVIGAYEIDMAFLSVPVTARHQNVNRRQNSG